MEALAAEATQGPQVSKATQCGKLHPRFLLSEKLCVELDGAEHFTESGIDYDNKRTAYLNSFDIQVVRFENFMVFERLEEVLSEIKSKFKNIPWPGGVPAGRGGRGVPDSYLARVQASPESIVWIKNPLFTRFARGQLVRTQGQPVRT